MHNNIHENLFPMCGKASFKPSYNQSLKFPSIVANLLLHESDYYNPNVCMRKRMSQIHRLVFKYIFTYFLITMSIFNRNFQV